MEINPKIIKTTYYLLSVINLPFLNHCIFERGDALNTQDNLPGLWPTFHIVVLFIIVIGSGGPVNVN